MKTIFQFFIFFLVVQMYAQKEAGSHTGQIYSYNQFTATRSIDTQDDFIGTTYLFPKWQNKGEFYINGKSYKLNNINLNVLNNDLETRMTKDSILVFDRFKIDSIIINNRKFKKYDEDVFYEVIFESSNKSLLKKYKVDVVEGTYNVAQGKYDKSKYKVTANYYLVENNVFSSFKPTKNSILEFCKGNEAAVKKFIKQNKLSFKKDADIAKILNYNASL